MDWSHEKQLLERHASRLRDRRTASRPYVPERVQLLHVGLCASQRAAKLLHRCGASRSGIFAVGASRVRAYPVSVYESLVDEYANYGTNGGIVSHYVERLYRGLFFCALSDTNRATHFLKVFFLHSKRALIWKFIH